VISLQFTEKAAQNYFKSKRKKSEILAKSLADYEPKLWLVYLISKPGISFCISLFATNAEKYVQFGSWRYTYVSF